MTLRTKTLLIIIATSALLVLTLYFAQGGLLLSSFRDLESVRARESAARAVRVLQHEIHQLDIKLSDWAAWDATWRYAAERDEQYERENIIPAAFETLQLTDIAIISPDGNVVTALAVSEDGESLVAPHTEMLALLGAPSALTRAPSIDHAVSGLLMIGGRPRLIASRAITTSEGEGPVRGTILFSRELGDERLEQLRQLAGVALTLRPADAAESEALVEVVRLSKSTLRTSAAFPDVWGNPTFRAEFENERLIYARGLAAVRALVIALCVAAAAYIGVVLWTLSRSVLGPIQRLAREVERAGGAEGRAVVITQSGPREIAQLAASVNETLRALERTTAAAQAASRAKSDFLANMSHEIRTPLTAMLGFADLIVDPQTPVEDRADLVAGIRRNGDHLLNLINEILDLARIEAGRLDLAREPCDPMAVLHDVVAALEGRARAKGLALHVEPVSELPCEILTDPLRLRQILINLLGNAIKFTPDGGVRVIVKLATTATTPAPLLRFEVVDTGPGVDAELLPLLFEPFTQADETSTRRHGGAGLGLTISRRLARALGGDIVATSVPDAGATFAATIATGPLDPAALSPREPVRPMELRGEHDIARLAAHILLAEDGPDNRMLITTVLRRAGAVVECVEDGRQAVDAATASLASGRPFDVILMDMQMPELDGYGAAAELRARGWGGPIIALTAHAMAGDRERCIAAGCDDYATKPVSPRALVELCDSWARRQPAARAA